jgi:hypothetical protein
MAYRSEGVRAMSEKRPDDDPQPPDTGAEDGGQDDPWKDLMTEETKSSDPPGSEER